MPTGHMDENVPKRLMKPDMLDMLEKAGWLMEMRSFWPKKGLSFFPRSGISASGPPASSAGCPDYRGDALLFFPEKWRCLWCLAVRPRRSSIVWSVSGSACSGRRSGIAWSVSGSACSGRRSGSAWSVSRMQCVDKCRTACMFCCFGMSLPQFCASGSSHCDEMPRLYHSSLRPGRELFGAAVWILEDLNGRCGMLACSVWGLLCRLCRRPKRRKRSKLRPKFWTVRVRCVRNVIKRSELRAWTEINQRRAEDSESLMVERGAINHVLAGLPVGVPEGAEPVREREIGRLILLLVLVRLILLRVLDRLILILRRWQFR